MCWVNMAGDPVVVNREMTANSGMEEKIRRVEKGQIVADVSELCFRDPGNFVAGGLHRNSQCWEEIAERYPSQ